MAVPAGVIVGWKGPHAGIPSGWSRVTAYDGRYVKAAAAASTLASQLANGGAATHNHSINNHSHTSHQHLFTLADSLDTEDDSGAENTTTNNFIAPSVHNHTLGGSAPTGASNAAGGTASAEATEVDRIELILIKSDGTGELTEDCVAYNSAASDPTGWQEYIAHRARYLKGRATAGNGGQIAVGGHTHTLPHSHTFAPHQHASWTSSTASPELESTDGSSETNSTTHTHSFSVSAGNAATHAATKHATNSDSPETDSGTPVLDRVRMYAINPTSPGGAIPSGVIAMWDGDVASIPSGWVRCDGTNGTFEIADVYLYGSTSSIGTEQSASAHTHAASHGHSFSGGGQGVSETAAANTGTNIASTGTEGSGNHIHLFATQTTTLASATATTGSATPEPLYRTIFFIQMASQGASVAGEAATSTATAPLPTASVSDSVAGAVATADAINTGEGDGIIVRIDEAVSGEAATATAAVNEAAVSATRNPTVPGEAATATAAASLPSIVAVRTATVASEVATATATALEALVLADGGTAVLGEVATAAVDTLLASVATTQNPTIAGAAAAAAAIVLEAVVVVTGSNTVAGEVATVAADTDDPMVVITATIAGEVAEAATEALEALVTVSDTVAGEAATASATVPTVTVAAVQFATILAELATATAEVPLSTVVLFVHSKRRLRSGAVVRRRTPRGGVTVTPTVET